MDGTDHDSEHLAWLDAIEASGLERIARLEAELLVERQRVDAARTLRGVKSSGLLNSAAISRPPAREEIETWPQLIKSMLYGEPSGLRVVDMVAKMEGTEWAAKHHRQPNSLYNTLARLTRSDAIRKVGKRYFHPSTPEPVSHDEEVEQSPSVEEGGIPQFIFHLLREGGPLPPGEIVARVRAEPSLAHRLVNNPDLPYTHISRLGRRGWIEKVGGAWQVVDDPLADQASLFGRSDAKEVAM